MRGVTRFTEMGFDSLDYARGQVSKVFAALLLERGV
jgi:hypothetical protein